MVTIIAKSSFITPMNLGTFFLGFLLDDWILFIKPPLYSLGVFLIGPFQWFLRSKVPSLEIVTKELPSPKIVCSVAALQFRSIMRTLTSTDPDSYRRCSFGFLFLVLYPISCNCRQAFRAFNVKSFYAVIIVAVPPCYTVGTVNTGNCTDFLMLSSLLSKSNDLIAYLLFGISTKLAGIDFFHACYVAYVNSKVYYFSAGLIM
jgi:hypothetical protein